MAWRPLTIDGPTCRTPPPASVQSISNESVHKVLSLEAPTSIEDDRSLGVDGEPEILCGVESNPVELEKFGDPWSEAVLNQLRTLIVDQKIWNEPKFQSEVSEKDAASLGLTI